MNWAVAFAIFGGTIFFRIAFRDGLHNQLGLAAFAGGLTTLAVLIACLSVMNERSERDWQRRVDSFRQRYNNQTEREL